MTIDPIKREDGQEIKVGNIYMYIYIAPHDQYVMGQFRLELLDFCVL